MAERPLLSLLYHLSSDRRLPHVDRLYPYKGIEAFERDLIYLREHFTPIDHDRIVAHFEGRSRLPPNAVEISFDDGLAECFSVVRPLLLKHGIPASFFVVTSSIDNAQLMFRNKISLCLNRLAELSAEETAGLLARIRSEFGAPLFGLARARAWIDGLQYEDLERIDLLCEWLGLDVAGFLREERPYLSRDEIRQLARDGFTLGAHTCNHPRLERLPWEAARREIVESCAAMRELTGARRLPFAIPFGGLGLPRNDLAALLRAEPGISLIHDTNDLMRDLDFFVNRIQVDTPLGARPTRSNLGLLIGRAHALEPLRALRRRLRSAASW